MKKLKSDIEFEKREQAIKSIIENYCGDVYLLARAVYELNEKNLDLESELATIHHMYDIEDE